MIKTVQKMTANWVAVVVLLNASLVTPLLAQEVRAALDRDAVSADDTVILTIETDSRLQGVSPDLNPLNKDFDILGTSHNSQIEVRNGRQSAKTQWLIQLAPKREGNIFVPRLRVGSLHTNPLLLQVKAPPSTTANSNLDKLFIEVQAKPEDPYVQSQIRYTIRLLYRVPLLDGTLEEPEPKDAIVERLGDDISYETTRNGKRYRVIERRYAIFPEKSGELTVPPVIFRGRIATPDNLPSQLDLFFSRRQGYPITVQSQPLAFRVRPRPADYSGKYWLPSADLTLQENFSKGFSEFRVGEPVTRTITLTAKGLAVSQLPELPAPVLARFRVYEEQPTTENQVDGDWLIGHYEQRIAVIPTEAGQFTLPALTLSWWDTQQDKQREAVLPAKEINVLPAVGAVKSTVSSKKPVPEPNPSSVVIDSTPSSPKQPAFAPSLITAHAVWPWLTGIFLLLWLATLGVWWRTRQHDRIKPTASPELPTATAARRTLRYACRSNNPQQAAKALLEWASVEWPEQPPQNLGALAARLAVDAAPVRQLDYVLYAPGPIVWNGTALWEAVKQGLRVKKPVRQNSQSFQLSPLYPEQS